MTDKRYEFSSLLADLVEQAQIAGNIVDVDFVKEFFADLELSEEKLRHVYAYLKASHIEIKGYRYEEKVEKEAEEYKRAAERRLEEAASEMVEETEKKRRKDGKKAEKSGIQSEFLRMYFEELDAVPPLTEKEETGLLLKITEGDATAEKVYAERKLHFVVERARGFKLSEEYFEELIEEGNIGLLLGISELKGQRGEKEPREFVEARIESAMRDFLEESLSAENTAASMVAKVSFVSDAAKRWKEDRGVTPTLKELASYTNLSEEELQDIMDLSSDHLKEK